MIDRIAPARRPTTTVAGYQSWRSLLFMHWKVPIDRIRRLVPPQLELDLFDGEAFVGIVPFEMKGIRPHWCPERLAFDFLETNVRTYVVCNNEPGVYFFSLEASSWIAVQVARFGWGLPYFHARMETYRSGEDCHYLTRRTRTNVQHRVHYRRGKDLGPSQPGTLEHFFLERYLLFVARKGQIWRGQVHHAPYPVEQAQIVSFNDDLMAAAGLPATTDSPAFAHYSPGVDVMVHSLSAT